jgi:ABC-type multidrug transport system fused ATPase/permease subunit
MTTPQKVKIIPALRLVFAAYSALDKEQRSIIFRKKIEGVHSPLYWKVILEKIAEFDSKADAIRPKIGYTYFTLLTASFFFNLCFFIFGILFGEVLFIIIQTLLLMVLLTGLLLLPIYIFLKSQDMPNYLRNFILPLLVILNEEMKAEESLHMSIDLRQKARKDNQADRKTNYKEGWTAFRRIIVIGVAVLVLLMILGIYLGNAIFISISVCLILVLFISYVSGKDVYPKIIHTTHAFPWFTMKGRLYDGTRLDLNISDEVHKYRITRSKRNSRGKIKVKTKIKYKIRTNYQVNLALLTHKYDLAHDLQAASKGTRTAEGVKIKNGANDRREVVKVNARIKSKELNHSADLQKLLWWIANAYQQFEVKNEGTV